MAYPITSPVLNWAIFLGAILGAIGLVWWLNKQLKGFLGNVSSHGVDHTWNRPWWGGGRRESSTPRERAYDDESAHERYYREPPTGRSVRNDDADAGKKAAAGEEEAEEEEPAIEYTTEHKSTLQAWSEGHAKEMALLKELHKDFVEARKKFQEILERQKEKIDALRQFETPAVWNNIQADTIKADIRKLRETTERIKALVDEIEEIIKNKIGRYLELLFRLFERDLIILKQEYTLKTFKL